MDLARDEVPGAMDELAAALAMVSTGGSRGGDEKTDEHLAGTTPRSRQLQQEEEEGEDKADDGVNVATSATGVSSSDGVVAGEGVVCAAEAIREAMSPASVGAITGASAPPSKAVSASELPPSAAASGISSSTATAVGVDPKSPWSATSEAISAPVPRPADAPSIPRSGGAVPVVRVHSAATSYPRAATPPITASPRRSCSTSANTGVPQVSFCFCRRSLVACCPGGKGGIQLGWNVCSCVMFSEIVTIL